ncbi:hypothetical protein SI65_05769 [Aspergillus cristatus]|uniref:Metallo-beta-lactamase domain-containing protein n=1 Tax=Aspergillus cristatus TaxID=573508 RepID=A0A1E3BDW3_ASPCR|nr:hypothetical protein SI65_05769 [Aspergillus cristatus]
MSRKINDTFDACFWEEYLESQGSRLPPLPDVERITPRVVRVLAGNPGGFQLQGTNTYLVGSGREKILIDTGQGLPVWIDHIAQVVAENDLKIVAALITHWHGDHTGGVPDLLVHFPHLTSAIYKNQPDRGQQDILDGQVFRVEGATIRALHTPGHAVDHMCFILEEEQAIFTGDNVLGHGFTVVEDLGAYTNSLGIMNDQGCQIGYPAHGVVITDMPAKMAEYRDQRLRRERQVISALRESRQRNAGRGSITVQEVVQSVHGIVPEEVSKKALEPFTQEVLLKLAGDRKVAFELQGGVKRWFIVGNRV